MPDFETDSWYYNLFCFYSRVDIIKRYYFDWAASAIPHKSTGEAPFGNPSSIHREGKAAREALEEARKRCAEVLEVAAKTLFFTSGGTESNAIVLFSTLLRPGGGGICYSAVEHPAVRENCLVLERMGKQIWSIPANRDGRIGRKSLEKAIEKHGFPRMAAIMGVNNETGAIMDLKGLGEVLRKSDGPRVHFHADLVQAAGKIPLDLEDWDLDSAAFSAHKLGGPRGIGLLYLKKPLDVLVLGGGQEGGIRSGTENTSGALDFAAALEAHAKTRNQRDAAAAAEKRFMKLISALRSIKRCTLIPEDRLPQDPRFSPWILQAAFRDIPGEVMARALDDSGCAVSTGSACSAASPERPVLAAMGLDPRLRLEGIRISQGWSTTDKEIENLIYTIHEVLEYL
ncbi:MAG: cysteine desulfurase [Treponema sp.]|jgi:cysteine desulfurase|nr:cysteine desulfurase [Treponema sp.]